MRVGVVGLGRMGLPMGLRLVQRGFDVRGFDADERARQRAIGAALRVVDSLDELGGVDTLVTMLPDGRAVRQVLVESGLVEVLAPRTTIIDSSSSDPADTAATGQVLLGAGATFLDAPVSGTPATARSGQLTMLVGGDPTSVSAARPVLDALGQTHHVGQLGAGHMLKALNNFLAATSLAAAGEALLAGRRFGIEPDVMLRAINNSTGRSAATENKVGQYILTRTFGSGFSLGLMRKDIAIAHSLIAAQGVSFGFARTCHEVWTRAIEKLGREADNTEVVRWMENVAGTDLGAAQRGDARPVLVDQGGSGNPMTRIGSSTTIAM